MRMIDEYFQYGENSNTIDRKRNKKIFCVSTDKAANPVNMMGVSKRIMEMYLMRKSQQIQCSTARL
jgi:FlaA1/EpsC-like NDP-sugar epimerase